ncbi:cytochrome C552 [Flavobacterium cyanobacteriorum]|uniref:Cytochrome C552 n=1 Tax=Flavobacterium cyanobacteriorum TaxID=2022802 RepID=A0A255ZA70_9FLAO|nr:c-type cytochrome [Flavobacterium cyanobacteriorum]OYQ38311.1 cytochrome C552 [Flavobacterium cyanobacteriorum]
MKQLLLSVLTIALFSCKGNGQKEESRAGGATAEVSEGAGADMTPSQKLGQEIFDGKGNCFSCHKPDQKIIGPSIQEIAKIYKEKNGSIVDFLKEKAKPIVDPSQYEVMKTNFAITKNLTDEELKGLEDYMYSFRPQQE